MSPGGPKSKQTTATQEELERALIDYVAALPSHLKPVKSKIVDFYDQRAQWRDTDTTMTRVPEFVKYQQVRTAVGKGAPAPVPQKGDIVFGLEALLAPRWDRRDVILDLDAETGNLLDKLGLISLPRLQVCAL